MIYSKYAIDYSKGFDLQDSLTKKIYSEQQAYQLPQEIKSRIILKPRKIGCMVHTLEECEEMLNKREDLKKWRKND